MALFPKKSEISSSTHRLQGKVAIVTGGAAGFGEAISLRFAEEGAKVIIADIAIEAGEQVASKSANITFQRTDVTKKPDWDALAEVALRKHGRLDILVNNAGATYSNNVRRHQVLGAWPIPKVPY